METELHTAEAHDAITAELVACTLGQRRHADRLELRVDPVGILLNMARNLRLHMRFGTGHGPTFYRAAR